MRKKIKVRICPTTGKRKFGGRAEALRAIQRRWTKNEEGFLCRRCGEWHVYAPDFRPYKCEHCGSWHLTSGKPACPNWQNERADRRDVA